MPTKNREVKNQITEGVIWKQILIFFFPILIGTLFQQLYNTVDAVIVGRFVGKEALASVGGSAAVLTNFVIGFFTGLSSGATVIISQFYGAKEHSDVHKSMHTAYAISIMMGLVVSVIGWCIAPWIFQIMKTPGDILADSVLYLRIYFAGLIATLIYNMGSAIMRAIGDSRRPLYYLVICCVLNIVLDLLFVVVLHMGIAGAAVATVISQVVSAILVTYSLMHSYENVKLIPGNIRLDKNKCRMEVRIGLPSAIQASIYNVSNIIIQIAINRLGTDTAAAWGAYGKLDATFWVVCSAFGIAMATFAGQNYGAGKKDRVLKSVRVCLFMAFASCGLIQFVLLMFSRPLLGIFTTDVKVIEIGVYMMSRLVPAYCLYVMTEIFTSALRGIGDVMVPTLIALGGIGLVRLPWVMILAPVYQHVDVLLYSYIVSWGVTLLLIIPYYQYQRRNILLDI